MIKCKFLELNWIFRPCFRCLPNSIATLGLKGYHCHYLNVTPLPLPLSYVGNNWVSASWANKDWRLLERCGVCSGSTVRYNLGLRPAHLVSVIFPHAEKTLPVPIYMIQLYAHFLLPKSLLKYDCISPKVLEHMQFFREMSVPVRISWRLTQEMFRQPRTLHRLPAGETHWTPRKFSLMK